MAESNQSSEQQAEEKATRSPTQLDLLRRATVEDFPESLRENVELEAFLSDNNLYMPTGIQATKLKDAKDAVSEKKIQGEFALVRIANEFSASVKTQMVIE